MQSVPQLGHCALICFVIGATCISMMWGIRVLCYRISVYKKEWAVAAKKKPSAAQFRMAEEKSKKKTPRKDAQGRSGMGASKAKKPGMSTTVCLS